MYRFYNKIPGILLVLLILGVFYQCGEDNQERLVYTVSWYDNNGKPQLNINLKFRANPTGITRLRYDNEAWGEESLFNCITNIKVADTSIVPEVNRDSGWIEIRHPRALDLINFQYSLVQDFDGEGGSKESYRPLIQTQYFHVFSHNMFVIPGHLMATAEDFPDITINWADFPENFKIHNSFGTGQAKQHLSRISIDEFHSAIFVGGDFRIYKEEIEGNAVYLASRGNWLPFDDREVMDVLAKTIRLQRDFWKDHSQDYFTVTLRPISQEEGSSFRGTGLTNSFAATISNNKHSDIELLVYLFNHELQHNWIGHTIENSNEEEEYWFSEGFTEYYAIKNISKNQIQDLNGTYFITQLNGIISNLYSSPVKEAPNSEINYDNFWSDRNYNKLPYYRGALFAFYLDHLIVRESLGKFSLDDVMHDLYQGAVQSDKKITLEYFVSVVNKYSDSDITSLAEKHIVQGKILPLANLFKTIGLEYKSTSEIFDLGFELSDDEKKVVAVDKHSAAYSSGLRAGDLLVARSINFGNTSQQVNLTVGRGSSTKAIQYFPVKEAKVPQLVSSDSNIELLRF